MSRLKLLVIAMIAAATTPALSQTCPPPLDEALRLVLVTAPDMESTSGALQLFTRDAPSQSWTPVSTPHPVKVGKHGMAWGLGFEAFKRGDEAEKAEGDKRTPAGIFRIGPSFGFVPSERPNYITVKPGETVCVEDPASTLYNTITERAQLAPETKADNMSDTSLFRNGLFVDYPSDRTNKRGSCIFIHIWKTPDTATSGCVAMPEPQVKALQQFAEGGAVVAIVPQTARDRFPTCLPDMSSQSE